MKAERKCREHTSRHTSPDDGDAWTARKANRVVIHDVLEIELTLDLGQQGRLPAFISRKRYFDYQKTKGAGFKPPREAARSFKSLEFRLRLGAGVRSRELLLDLATIYGHVSSESTVKIIRP